MAFLGAPRRVGPKMSRDTSKILGYGAHSLRFFPVTEHFGYQRTLFLFMSLRPGFQKNTKVGFPARGKLCYFSPHRGKPA